MAKGVTFMAALRGRNFLRGLPVAFGAVVAGSADVCFCASLSLGLPAEESLRCSGFCWNVVSRVGGKSAEIVSEPPLARGGGKDDGNE